MSTVGFDDHELCHLLTNILKRPRKCATIPLSMRFTVTFTVVVLLTFASGSAANYCK